ncbi:MAG: DUF3488 domain-containing transglutaminase family protein [Burkholderiales bacterium]|nr:DUF3488 domain-containing transglutaminase family protein [Burkholderiales bacterium]
MKNLLFSKSAWQNLARDKADTLLLLTACLLVILPHASHLPIWNTVAACGILLWRAYVTFSGKRMPSRWILLPIAVACMIAVRLSNNAIVAREPGVALLVLLLALKLLEMHAKRDLFVVTYLSFFLILSNFLYSQSMLTAVLMFAALLAILTAQMSFQYTGKVPPLKQRLRQSAQLLALAIPLTLVLFVLFPRIQGPLWGMPGDAAGRSGLSDSMAPGNVSNLALSEEVAFRVQFYDPPPPQSQLYWRGPVLGNYDGRTWSMISWGDLPVFRMPKISVTPLSAPIRYQVTMEASGQHSVFALELPRLFPVIDGESSLITRDMQILARHRISKRTRYEASSVTQFMAEVDVEPEILRRWLTLPRGLNPRALEFARQLMAREPDQGRQIDAVLQFFRQENFSYTLQPPLLGQNAVDDFLFNTRAGFCEHYASSFVYLMRAMQIPARVVTGYQGGEINPVDGVMTVRQSDAHAWAEVWLPNRGWRRIDPTSSVAPERVEQNLARALPRSNTLLSNLGGLDVFLGNDSFIGRVRNQFQAINNAWSQWVLDYTPEKQRNFFSSLGFEEVDWVSMMRVALGLGALVMAAIIFPLIRHQGKRDPLDALYSRFEAKMAKRGLARLAHEGPFSWGQRLAQQQAASTKTI